MIRSFKGLLAITALAAIGLAAIAPATAAPNCLRGHKPFELKGDHVAWDMPAPAAAECLQGMRWSYMQIYEVALAVPPKHGKLEILGPGFRYTPDPNATGLDRFRLHVVGKNRRDVGASIVEITVTPVAREAL